MYNVCSHSYKAVIRSAAPAAVLTVSPPACPHLSADEYLQLEPKVSLTRQRRQRRRVLFRLVYIHPSITLCYCAAVDDRNALFGRACTHTRAHARIMCI